MTMRGLRLLLWALVGLAAAGTAVLLLRAPPPVPSAEMPLATIGGPFTLTGSDGKPFASSRLAGKPYAIFFGFTHCPDVCPTTLARLVKLRGQLGDKADALAIVFVSVDPERDTPAEMARYAGLFEAPIVALTGSQAAIDRVKQQFGVFSEKVPAGDGDYSVDHTATVFLMDAAGKFVATISHDEGDAAALAKLERLTA